MDRLKNVRIIPATIDRRSKTTLARNKIRRVAGYARVSTDYDEQTNSYQAQVDYYTNFIKSRPDWKFVKIYTDEGISGTSTKRRAGFNAMIKDALDGKIDLIITKSVSRFARNTVDSLSTIRKLKENNVECYFEKENVWTFDTSGELMITLMSSLAQEESRSISESVTWGRRRTMEEGKVYVPYSRFLGYTKGKEKGTLAIVPEEAEIVRRIYGEFLKGRTIGVIAKNLTEDGIPTPAGKKIWKWSTISSILRNEKYKGDAILQKTFTTDFLTKKAKKNNGEVPQYHITGSHPAIISPEVFELVQKELERRKDGSSQSSTTTLSGKLMCGICGHTYGSKVWHSNDKYRTIVWQCNHKYAGKKKCTNRHIKEDEVKREFLKAIEPLITDEAPALLEILNKEIFDTSQLEKEVEELKKKLSEIESQIEGEIRMNSMMAQDQEEYTRRYNTLCDRFSKIEEEIAIKENSIKDLIARKQQAQDFCKSIDNLKGKALQWDDELWATLVEKAVVTPDGIEFIWNDGTDITNNQTSSWKKS